MENTMNKTASKREGPMDPQPVTLDGRFVRLEPLSMDHVPDLDHACKDSPDGRRTIWRYLLDARIYRESGMQGVVKTFLDRQAAGTDLPFAVIDLKSGNAVGTTRFMEIELDNRVIEVGTWLGLNFQREGLNLESKRLMLKHAFNELGAVRVQFKIDHRNFASLDAIERLRAYREGVLRNHIILADGTPRSSVYYSILDSEWPAIEVHLETLMERSLRD
jgi:RimJ/RimL family protein N-acetyltransferase